MEFLDNITFGFIQFNEFGDWIIFFGLLASYFVPTVIAYMRDHINRAPIFIINVFLGITFIGWVVALAWSLTYQFPEDRE